MQKLNKNIKEFRISKGYTQAELAEKLHISKQAVSKWETGRGLPDISLIQDISLIFGVSPDVLISGKKYHRFLFLCLILILIAVVLISFPLIMTYQKMLFTEVYLFSLSDYEALWWGLTFIAGSLTLMEMTCLLLFFGHIKKKSNLPLRKSLFIGLGFHILYTLFGYVVIWLFLTKQSTNNYRFVFLILVVLAIVEFISLVLLFIKTRKEYIFWKTPDRLSYKKI